MVLRGFQDLFVSLRADPKHKATFRVGRNLVEEVLLQARRCHVNGGHNLALILCLLVLWSISLYPSSILGANVAADSHKTFRVKCSRGVFLCLKLLRLHTYKIWP